MEKEIIFFKVMSIFVGIIVLFFIIGGVVELFLVIFVEIIW